MARYHLIFRRADMRIPPPRARPATAIDLSGTDITGSGLAIVADAVAVNTSLMSLRLRGCKVGSSGVGVQRIAAALQTNRTLRSLDLGDTDLDIESITQVRGGTFTRDSTMLPVCIQSPKPKFSDCKTRDRWSPSSSSYLRALIPTCCCPRPPPYPSHHMYICTH